jgi:TatD DNase family protein
MQEMKNILELGLYIGINGCSLKTEENLEIVKEIPLDRIMVETDCPYCAVRKTSAAWDAVKTTFKMAKKKKYDPDNMKDFIVRERNEPCLIVQVIEIIASIK